MKKTIALMLIFIIFLTSFSLALPNNNSIVKSKVTGLQNAQLQVKNEQQKQLLEQVMNKIQTKQREQLNKLQNLTIKQQNNITIAEGLEKKKFLFLFKVERKEQYQIQDDGTVLKYKKPFDFLFSNYEE